MRRSGEVCPTSFDNEGTSFDEPALLLVRALSASVALLLRSRNHTKYDILVCRRGSTTKTSREDHKSKI